MEREQIKDDGVQNLLYDHLEPAVCMLGDQGR